MDPTKFGISSVPLNHAPYSAISPSNLKDANKGKVAIVTGGARGIGRAISENLANSGAHIAILDVLSEPLQETKALCEKYGVNVKVYLCDVTDMALLRNALADAEKTLGPVDILVNNTGVTPHLPQSMEAFESFWRTMEINFKSYMATIWTVLPGMRERKSGVIINIASRAATVDIPFGLGYNSSKAAITRATSSLQEEIDMDGLGDSIQVHALHPGGVLTDIMKDKIPPELIAKYPTLVNLSEHVKTILNDSPDLCGATCAYLATGKAKEIRGMYFDCRQDIERVCDVGRKKMQELDLYRLKMDFIEEYKNEP